MHSEVICVLTLPQSLASGAQGPINTPGNTLSLK